MRRKRNKTKWFILGISGGLMVLVRYDSAIFLLLPFFDVIERIWKSDSTLASGLKGTGLLSIGIFIALIPNFIVKRILYGSFLKTGYSRSWTPLGWNWTSLKIIPVLFSSRHGIFTWTPILLFATVGLFLFFKKDKKFALYLAILYLLMLYLVSCLPDWWQDSSFGGRYFISCTPIFIFGLASLIEMVKKRISLKWLSIVGFFLIIWNFLFIIQFGLGLIPRENYISWRKMAYNQIFVVPKEIVKASKVFFSDKTTFKKLLEQRENIQREEGIQR